VSGGSTAPVPAHGTSVWRRYMELPRYLRTVHGPSELSHLLIGLVSELGFDRVRVVSGGTYTARIGARLALVLGDATRDPVRVRTNTHDEVERVTGRLRGDVDAAVAVGGGKTIDVAKAACAAADVPLLVVPTQLTADGIASPVSVIKQPDGALRSGHGRLPIAVVVDMEVIASAPPERTRAGIGDLVANRSALVDWRLAAEAGAEEVDDFAALLSASAVDLVYGAARDGLRDAPFLDRLLRGLVLSGLAMEIAGSSRPCSGAEHLISHALDSLRPGTAQHGDQVAFGSLVATHLQGGDWRAMREFMMSAGLTDAAQGFGLAEEELVAAVRAAPSMRPDRHTILSEPRATPEAMREAVRAVVR
jgi:glycerol-1-phosphate dehydrogenase [NAD(P)+]